MNNQQYHPVHSVYDGIFNTASGRQINLINPAPDTIDIRDISCALSKICRFGGNINHFYTVAQHSLLVCSMAPYEIKLEALLHDAAEAFLGDVIKPLKVLLGRTYTDIEDRFMAAISAKFSLSEDKLAQVKEYDRQALQMEHEHFQKGNDRVWHERLSMLGLAGFEEWNWMRVSCEFITAFHIYQRHTMAAKTSSFAP